MSQYLNVKTNEVVSIETITKVVAYKVIDKNNNETIINIGDKRLATTLREAGYEKIDLSSIDIDFKDVTTNGSFLILREVEDKHFIFSVIDKNANVILKGKKQNVIKWLLENRLETCKKDFEFTDYPIDGVEYNSFKCYKCDGSVLFVNDKGGRYFVEGVYNNSGKYRVMLTLKKILKDE